MDGCPAGWVLVTTPSAGVGTSHVDVVTDLGGVFGDLDEGRLVAVAIDVPIGLAAADARQCDIEARKLIGQRRSSVFPAPSRAVLGAETYEDAVATSRAISGKGISRQLFGILPKIEEVDRLLTPERQSSFVETHPEVGFAILGGRPMAHHKSESEGRAERLDLLRTVFTDVDSHVGRKIPGTGLDDVLDAFVAAWSARRWAAQTHLQLGGEVDERGLRMEMIV
jgi:predicted RNase H-like nuclease